MIQVKYEKYINDFDRTEDSAKFEDLKEVADWIFGQMRRDYSDPEKGMYIMNFPVQDPYSISFTPVYRGPIFWIHQMEEDGKIIFSDGRMTAGQKHWSKAVKKWCQECDQRQKKPVFDFAE